MGMRPLGNFASHRHRGAGRDGPARRRQPAVRPEQTRDRPVDACIAAIVDAVEIDGTYTYEKHRAAEAARASARRAPA
jgi:hypothetical protein